MTNFQRKMLIERSKLIAAAITLGCMSIYATYEIYGAWSSGEIRARRQGVVSLDNNPLMFWFTVFALISFVVVIVLVCAAAVFLHFSETKALKRWSDSQSHRATVHHPAQPPR